MDKKVVVITGGASGIGAEFAFQYASKNTQIALLDMDTNGLKATSEKLSNLGVENITITVDITSKEKVKEAFDTIINKFKGIDVLINNAGISHISKFENTSVEVIEKVMAVNFNGVLYCTHEAINHIIKRKGKIIAISSVAGFSPLIGRTGYCASKHAMHGFFNALQSEVRNRGVQVLIACPSFVKTNLEANTFNENGETYSKKKSTAGNLMTSTYVVSKILKALNKNKNIVFISKTSRLVSFFLPHVFENKMRKKVEKDL
jgi:short-subunit dehydrogenase